MDILQKLECAIDSSHYKCFHTELLFVKIPVERMINVNDMMRCSLCFRGENVEDAFLDTAKKIYQNIQDGR